jgi:hypothetical protein
MSNVYVYSTLSAPVRYSTYAKGEGDMSREESSVLIRGGANVADKNFITPRGVQTIITAEEHAKLKENKLFQTHFANGFITVDEKQVDIDKIVADMTPRDQSSPLVPQDYEPEKEPVSNAAKKGGRPAKSIAGHPAKRN